MKTTLLLLIFCTACQAPLAENKNFAQDKTIAIDKAINSAIVFVPGFYGTELEREDTGEKIWITFYEAVFGSATLVIPHPALKLEGRKLKPGGLLSSVRVIPGLYSYSIYEPTFAFLQDSFGSNNFVTTFTYDWRGDALESIRELDKFILNLRAKGMTKVTLVSHSLGAYLCAYYLRYGTQEMETAVETWAGSRLVQNAALLTAPFKGSGFIFRNFHYGREVALNKKILEPAAFASFPISYYFVPQLQRDFIVDKDRKPLKISVADAKEWEKNGWGLFFNEVGNQDDPAVAQSRLEFTKMYLGRGKKFLELLNQTGRKNTDTRIFSLVAEAEPTINQIKLLGKSVIEDPYTGDIQLKAPGDGTLTVETQTLPEAFSRGEVEVMTSRGGHLEVLNSEEFKARLKKWLN